MRSLSSNFRTVWRHRDFRLLWFGAMLSFVGSWIQNVAQGWLVYELTKSEAMLGLVTFCGNAPVALVGPIAGTLADVVDKRKLLIWCQVIFGLGALSLGWAILAGHKSFEHVLIVATIGGFTGAFEMPARQSMISSVVPLEDLPKAVPINAMTFNSARLIGPAIGAILLKVGGPSLCYMVNGFSFVALIAAALAIRADLSATRYNEPIKDLIFEGMLFTLRDARLRTLFLMEAITSTCGLVYISQLPAFCHERLQIDESGYALTMSVIGVGAILALLLNTSISHRADKRPQVLTAMFCMGAGLCLVAFQTRAWAAIPIFAVVGGATIIQFNTTNALFQTIAPPRLRGRVIAMHVWALSGVGPFGTLALSWIAERSKAHGLAIPGTTWASNTLLARIGGIPLALSIGGLAIMTGAIWGYSQREKWRTDEETPVSG